MRESCTYGSVRGALSNERPYRDRGTRRARRKHAGTLRFSRPTNSIVVALRDMMVKGIHVMLDKKYLQSSATQSMIVSLGIAG